MWLSNRREQQPVGEGSALTGPVTVPGDPAAAWLEGERRGVTIYAPGGYHWAPQEGQELLVLKAGTDGESPCGVGVTQKRKTGRYERPLAPGEVLIESGDAQVRLSRDRGAVVSCGGYSVNVGKQGMSLWGGDASVQLNQLGEIHLKGKLMINGVYFQPAVIQGGA